MSKAWPTVRLGEVLTPVRREASVDPLGEYRLLGVRLDGNGPFLRETVTGSQTAATKLFRVAEGDFIYSRLFACRGALGVIEEKLDGCYVSGEFPTFTPVSNRVDVQFLRYWFRLPAVIARVDADCSGSTPLTRNRFNERYFVALEIPLPPLAEQRRVVARIEELAGQVQEARGLRQQAMAETDALVPATATRLDRDARRIYPMTTLEHFAAKAKGSLRSGPFGSALLHKEFVSEGVPAIGIQDVQENRFALSRKWNVTDHKAAELARYAIRPHDLLVTVMGTLGRTCVVPGDAPHMVSTKHVWTVTLDRQIAEPQWLSYWLNYSRFVRDELLGQGSGTAIPGLNGAKLRSLSLPNIPISAQRGAVAELDSAAARVDALSRLQAEVTVELDALLPAILDRAFKGELL